MAFKKNEQPNLYFIWLCLAPGGLPLDDTIITSFLFLFIFTLNSK